MASQAPEGTTSIGSSLASQRGLAPMVTRYHRRARRPSGFTQDSVAPSQYDGAALQFYEKFVQMRNLSLIPAGVRFQVSLPSPFACIQGHVRPELHEKIEPFYERWLLESLDTIIAGIPASDLAIQWDLPFEVGALEHERGRLPADYLFRPQFVPVRQGLLDSNSYSENDIQGEEGTWPKREGVCLLSPS